MRFRTSALILAAGACALAANTAMAQSQVYARDNRLNRALSFPVNAPAPNVIWPSGTFDGYAMDFSADATVLYGIQEGTATLNPLHLGTIDLTTGAFSSIGVMSGDGADVTNWTGLAIGPDNTFYGSSSGNLYLINPATAATTLIGSFGTGGTVIDIAIDSQGNMYAHDIGTDSLYSVDKSSGAATLIGPTGFAAGFAQGMDFDWATDTLYAHIYISGGVAHWASFDLTTGAATSLLDTSSWNSELEIAIASPIPEPGSLAVLGLGGLGLLRRRRVNA